MTGGLFAYSGELVRRLGSVAERHGGVTET
jgi:hypothetical protein